MSTMLLIFRDRMRRSMQERSMKINENRFGVYFYSGICCYSYADKQPDKKTVNWLD